MSKADYVRWVSRAYLQARTGVVHARAGGQARRIYFVDGLPVALESDRGKDSIEATLARAKLLDFDTASRLVRHAGPRADLRDLLVTRGGVDAEALDRLLERRIGGGLAAPLAWARPEAFFESFDELPDRVDRQKVELEIPVMHLLWRGVGRYIMPQEVLGAVLDPGRGPVRATETLVPVLEELALGPPLSGLPARLAGSVHVDELLEDLGDRSGTLERLLWMLEVAGVVERGEEPERISFTEGHPEIRSMIGRRTGTFPSISEPLPPSDAHEQSARGQAVPRPPPPAPYEEPPEVEGEDESVDTDPEAVEAAAFEPVEDDLDQALSSGSHDPVVDSGWESMPRPSYSGLGKRPLSRTGKKDTSKD